MLSVTALATILVIDVVDLTIAAICVNPELSIPISESVVLLLWAFYSDQGLLRIEEGAGKHIIESIDHINLPGRAFLQREFARSFLNCEKFFTIIRIMITDLRILSKFRKRLRLPLDHF